MPTAELSPSTSGTAPGLSTREASLVPATFDEAANTIDVVFSTGARGIRYDWADAVSYDEELEVTPAAVDLSRIDAGVVQVLDSHSHLGGIRAVLGVAIKGWVANGQAMARIRLSNRDDVRGIADDIKAGIIRAVSAGYSVQEWQTVQPHERTDGAQRPLRIAKRWTVHEISFVPVPFDMGASVRAAAPGAPGAPINSTDSKGNIMPTQQVQSGADQTVAEEITSLCKRHHAPELTAQLIERGASLEQAREAVLNHLVERDIALGGHLNARPTEGRGHARNSAEMMVEALAARMAGARLTTENPYRNLRMADLARECLEVRGIRTTSMSAAQLIERGLHTTSDFPQVLAGAGQRVLREAYATYQGGIKRACKPSTAKDFRDKQRLQLGEAPELLKINEAGEFTRGSMAEAATAYKLATYGRVFGISRQALVNDDLDAFGDMAVRLGRAASEFEAKFLVALLTSNPTMNDSVALFHATHGNLLTGAGSALSMTALSDARKAMRLQKGLDKATPIDATPRYLIVPAALETTGEQLIAAIAPAQTADVNPFAGRLELIVDPRLDAISTTAWYLSADSRVIDTIEYAYLEDADGPEVFTREGFEVDGMEMKVRLDFGGGVLDWRGLLKANGA